ncbi:MAG: cadherin-like domain-containing protein, partial [Coriobacteriia bacterium]|nr:cadherin-like domain-containing protein [Coriobacteriia bacterium]
MHHAHAGLRVRPLAWLAAVVTLAVLLGPATAAIAADTPVIASGVVSGPGTPSRIEGATVSASWYDPDFDEWLWSGDDVTDSAGLYVIYDQLGYGQRDYTFVVRAYGYVTQWRVEYWNGVDPLTLDFALIAAKPVATGKVYAGVGAPLTVAGAEVRALWKEPVSEEWFSAGEAVTDGAGVYTLYDEYAFGAGTYRFVVEAQGFEPQDHEEYWSGASPISHDYWLVGLPHLFRGEIRGGRDLLPGARIEAWWLVNPTAGEYTYAGEAISRANGSYDLYGQGTVGSGVYVLRVFADGFLPAERTTSWGGEGPVSESFVLVATGTIAHGVVIDADADERIEGARVSAYRYLGANEWGLIGTETTDEEGLFTFRDTFNYGSGDYKFVAEADGYLSEEYVDEWDGYGPLQPEIRMTRLSVLATGKVIDSVTLLPVEGARVEVALTPPTGGLQIPVGDGFADADGVFAVYDTLGAGSGFFQFRTSAPGYLTDLREWVWWAGGTPLVLEIRLDRRPPVAVGLVSDVETGLGIAGAEVTAYWIDPDTQEYLLSGVTTTTPDGMYAVYDEYDRHEESGNEMSEYRFEVRAEGYFSGGGVGYWDGFDSLDISVALYPMPPIARGMVDTIDSSFPVPVEGARIEAEWHEGAGEYLWAGDAYSHKDGTYAVYDEMGRGGGEYRFSCSAEGYYTRWQDGVWYVEDALDINYRLVPVLPVAIVTVIDGSTSGPLDGATVQAFQQDPADLQWRLGGEGHTGPQGTCDVYDEEDYGAGDYRFVVSAAGYASQEHFGTWGGPGWSPIHITARLTAAAPLVQGMVTDSDSGWPIEDAGILATRYDTDAGEWTWAGFVGTGPDGTYLLYDSLLLGPGEYEFFVEAEGYLPQTRSENWNGTTTLSFNFALETPPPVATGTVRDAWSTAPVGGARVEALWWDAVAEEYLLAGFAYTDGAGEYEVYDDLGYGSGGYEIHAQASGYAPETAARAWDGETPHVVNFALDAQTSIAAGTVTEAGTGTPLEDARVMAFWYDDALEDYLWAGTAFSSGTGTYAVDDQMDWGPGDYRFYVEADGYTPQFEHGYWNGSSTLAVNFALELLAPLGSDAYEPDDTPGQAGSITVGAPPQSRTLWPAGDRDWVCFPVQAGMRYVIETSHIGPWGSDTVLFLYLSGGDVPIAEDDDGGEDYYSRIEWIAPFDMNICILVHAFDTEHGVGDYGLSVTAETATNTPPVAVNDSFTTPFNTALSVPAPGVLANDTDADGDPITAHLLSGPASGTGTVTLNANGAFTYTPPAGFLGAASFTYRAYDGTHYSPPATVSISVLDTTPPAKPVVTLERDAWGKVTVKWNAVSDTGSGMHSYRLYQDGASVFYTTTLSP